MSSPVYSIGTSESGLWTLVQSRAPFSLQAVLKGARWAHLGCVKDQKHVRARHPYKATVTPGPFASYHARRLELSLPAPKPTLSYPLPTRCMERKGSERSGFLWLIWSSFRRKQGGMGAAYGRYGKSGAGHHTRDLPTLFHPLPDPYPLKTIP